MLGDAAAVPTSKAGSVAHFAVDCFAENFLRYIDGLEMHPSFDGHANCFIESGFGKGLLIDFNYDVEPLPGRYPLPGVGPFTLLQESEMNHWGKMMFRWMYWNILLKGQELPLPGAHEHVGQVAQVRRTIMDQSTRLTSGFLAELNQKIDLLTTQVQFLTEQAQRAERAAPGTRRADARRDAHRQRRLPPDRRAAGGGAGIRRSGRSAAPAQAAAAQRPQHRQDAGPARERDGSGRRPSAR